jgi:hypothetical protein
MGTWSTPASCQTGYHTITTAAARHALTPSVHPPAAAIVPKLNSASALDAWLESAAARKCAMACCRSRGSPPSPCTSRAARLGNKERHTGRAAHWSGGTLVGAQPRAWHSQEPADTSACASTGHCPLPLPISQASPGNIGCPDRCIRPPAPDWPPAQSRFAPGWHRPARPGPAGGSSPG